jgi:hypothetical protein
VRDNDNAPGKNPKASDEPKSKLARWWPAVMNFWIAVVILLFFVLRVFDSRTAQRIWHSLAAR